MISENYSRNLVGYGRNSPDPKWPGGARIAVQFVINYEEGGESCILDNDKASESLLSEIVGAQPWPGQRNLNMESIYEYGSRAGFWRLWRMFTDLGVTTTVYGVTAAMARNPQAVAAMKEAGWGNRQPRLSLAGIQGFFRGGRAKAYCRSRAPAYGADGRAPLWHVSGQAFRQYVASRHGRGWFSLFVRFYADDLPYWVKGLQDEPFLIIPYTLDTNDMRFATPQGFNSGDQFFAYLKDAFDVLYQEGLEGAPKMMSVGLHCRLVGRPGRAAALRRFIEYVLGHERCGSRSVSRSLVTGMKTTSRERSDADAG